MDIETYRQWLSKFKPLKAVVAEDLDSIKLPVYASDKLDGVRVVMLHGKASTARELKPIGNDFIRNNLEKYAAQLEGVDGEIIVGSPRGYDVFNRTSGPLRRQDGQPDFKFYIFDIINDQPYKDRWDLLQRFKALPDFVEVLPQTLITNMNELTQYEKRAVDDLYEGVMVRSVLGRYKFGRSTLNEGILLKIKPFEDDEAIIIDFEEGFHNENPAEKNAYGHTVHSSHQSGYVARGTLGALVCRSKKWELDFNIGTGIGLDDWLRNEIWQNKEKYQFRPIKYRFQRHGSIDRPRIPSFQGFTEPGNLTEEVKQLIKEAAGGSLPKTESSPVTVVNGLPVKEVM